MHVLDGYGIEGGFAQMQFVARSNPKPQAYFLLVYVDKITGVK